MMNILSGVWSSPIRAGIDFFKQSKVIWQSNLKMGKTYEQTAHQRRYIDGKYVHEKVLYIMSSR